MIVTCSWFVTGKMPFKSSKFKGSRTDKKGGVARFDNSQNVKVSLSTASARLNGRE